MLVKVCTVPDDYPTVACQSIALQSVLQWSQGLPRLTVCLLSRITDMLTATTTTTTPGRWLLEEASTSTRTNAWYSLDIIAQQQQEQEQQQLEGQRQQQQQECVLIITSPFHQLRSYYTFRRAAQQKGLSIQVGQQKVVLLCAVRRHKMSYFS